MPRIASPALKAGSDGSFLDLRLLSGAQRGAPLFLPWPIAGNPGAILSFSTAAEWRDFILCLSLPGGIPEIVAAKFRRAQQLYFLTWLYFDVIKAGELVALTALELALKDRYGDKVRDSRGQMPFARLLNYMLSDGLTDDKIPMVQHLGGSAVGFLTGEARPTLAEMRNSLAHGDPFDGLPYGGLLELVRDLIGHAYRHVIKSAT